MGNIRNLTALALGLYLFIQMAVPTVSMQDMQASPPSAAVDPAVNDERSIESNAYRSGRGSYRSPAGGYTGGNRNPISPGIGTGTTRPGANNPVNPAPGASGGRFGSFFGGLAAGTLLGGILNPFGFGGYGGAGFGTGFSLVGILFWAVILYMAYRVLRRFFGRAR